MQEASVVGRLIVTEVLFDQGLPEGHTATLAQVHAFCEEAGGVLDWVDSQVTSDPIARIMVDGCRRGIDHLRTTADKNPAHHVVRAELRGIDGDLRCLEARLERPN